MAFAFSPDNPVLNFGPRAHERYQERSYLCWPAWAYRVVAPRVRQRDLNVLQRAVMGLCRAGMIRADEQAEHLSVHRDLTAFIMSELRGLGHLEASGVPTQHGIKVLEDDTVESHEMAAGFVFQDPWNGDLWPRFADRLVYCDREFNEAGFPVLLFGSTGKPVRKRACTVLPRIDLAPSCPSASAVVEAVARHRRALRFKRDDEADNEAASDFSASGIQISRVSFVEEAPQPVFLISYLYLLASEDASSDWYACDPFGLGQSPRLRRRVESLMHEDPKLYSTVDQLVGSSIFAGLEEQKKWYESLEQRARIKVEHRLTVDIQLHGAFRELLAMEAAHQEMLELGGSCPDRKVDEVLRSGVKVLESLFGDLSVEHPLDGVWHRLFLARTDPRTGKHYWSPQMDNELCRAICSAAIHSVGFPIPAPQALTNAKPGQIRAVAEYGDTWRLRPLVMATLLCASQNEAHPLRRAAQKHPRLLESIDGIASRGGGAGHAGGARLSAAEAGEHAQQVYDVVAAILDLVDVNRCNGGLQSGGTNG